MTGKVKLVSAGGGSVSLATPSTGSNRTVTLPDADLTIPATNSSGTLTTQGDTLYRDGSGIQRLAKGTAGQVLKMNAGATAPEWAAAAAPELSITGQTNWTSIGEVTSVDITGIASGAKRLEMYFKGLSHAAAGGNQNFRWVLGDSGGFETSGYTNTGWYTGPSNTAEGADTTNGFQFNGPSSAGYIMRGVMRLYKMDDSDHEWYCEAFSAASTGGYRFGFNGLKTLSGELTQIQINLTGSDNFDAGGEYKLYTWT